MLLEIIELPAHRHAVRRCRIHALVLAADFLDLALDDFKQLRSDRSTFRASRRPCQESATPPQRRPSLPVHVRNLRADSRFVARVSLFVQTIESGRSAVASYHYFSGT